MNKERLDHYIHNDISFGNIRKFVNQIVGNSTEGLGKQVSIMCKVAYIPKMTNGYTLVINKRNSYSFFLFINAYPFLKNKANPVIMTWFYIYVSVLHEIEHIKVIMNLEEEISYSAFLAISEEMQQGLMGMLDRIIYLALSRSNIDKYAYLTSAIEIFCRRKSLNDSLHTFKDFFTKDQYSTVEDMLNEIIFIENNLEIEYKSNKMPTNKFIRRAHWVQRYVEEKNNYNTLNKSMKIFVDAQGRIRSPENIYMMKDDSNKALIDSFLIQLFLNLDFDYSFLFTKNADFKKYMEGLANQYCEECIMYLETQKMGVAFLNENIIKDNSLLIAKNIVKIDEMMQRYQMSKTSGSVMF